MQNTMQRNAGVFRNEKSLKEGCDTINELYQQFHNTKINNKGLTYNADLIEALELENLQLAQPATAQPWYLQT